jgi:phosphate:Na+ symporter
MSPFELTVGILGGLALFLFGMRIMSDGLQKLAGDKMRSILGVMTGNRFAGVFTGLFITTAIQSSSAATVMLVGFVHAGLVSLQQSVGVIMGANIGTTITGWMVAAIGFKIHISAMALPCIALGFFLRFFAGKRLTNWGEFLLGFGILFLGLDFMKEAVTELKDSPQIMSMMSTMTADTLLRRVLAVIVGMLVTFVVQSSSATMAVTMTLAAEGMIDVHTACALILGDNIGTTITANLASIGASTSAKRAARVHSLFNVVGAVWGVLLFVPFVSLVGAMVPGVLEGGATKAALATFLAAYHSLFNVINTILWLPFVKQLAWLGAHLVPEAHKLEVPHLKYLDAPAMESAPMALFAARKEVRRMLDEVRSMLEKTMLLITHPDEKLGTVAEEVFQSEIIVDTLEREITRYLVEVVRLDTSMEDSTEIAGLLTCLHDLERMGDHCEMLTKLAKRRYDNKLPFGEDAIKDILEIGGKVRQFLELLSTNMQNPSTEVLTLARNLENSINAIRKQARRGHIERLNAGECGVDQGLIYIDMLNSFEKIGDHATNVAEMLAGDH